MGVLFVIDVACRGMHDLTVGTVRVPAILLVGLLLVLAGCGRAPVTKAPIPTPEASAPPIAEIPVVAVTPPSDPNLPPPPAPPAPPPPAPPAPPGNTPNPGPLTITGLPLHTGDLNFPYAPVTFGASGGHPPYSWSISSGSLAGLNLSSGGTVSGTPVIAGSFSFTATVLDAAGGSVSANGSITINVALRVVELCSTSPCAVEQYCNTVCGTYASPSGGTPPYQYALYKGSPPTGTTLNANAPSLGGSFTTVGSFSFYVTVTDAIGASQLVSSAFSVFTHIAFLATSAKCGGTLALGCSTGTQLTYTGGSGTIIVKLAKVAPATGYSTTPPGWSGSASGGSVVIKFLPTKIAWVGTVTFFLTDSNLCGPAAYCTSPNQATVYVSVT